MPPVRLSIQEAAKQIGVSVTTLRVLEKRGTIPEASRDWNGHRYYTPEDVERLISLLFPADRAS